MLTSPSHRLELVLSRGVQHTLQEKRLVEGRHASELQYALEVKRLLEGRHALELQHTLEEKQVLEGQLKKKDDDFRCPGADRCSVTLVYGQFLKYCLQAWFELAHERAHRYAETSS